MVKNSKTSIQLCKIDILKIKYLIYQIKKPKLLFIHTGYAVILNINIK